MIYGQLQTGIGLYLSGLNGLGKMGMIKYLIIAKRYWMMRTQFFNPNLEVDFIIYR